MAQTNAPLGEKEAAQVFKALSSPTRLRIFRLLYQKERYCGDIVELVGLAQSTVSHHLKVLVQAGLIIGEEEGPATCYRVNKHRCQQVCELLQSTLHAYPHKEY